MCDPVDDGIQEGITPVNVRENSLGKVDRETISVYVKIFIVFFTPKNGATLPNWGHFSTFKYLIFFLQNDRA